MHFIFVKCNNASHGKHLPIRPSPFQRQPTDLCVCGLAHGLWRALAAVAHRVALVVGERHSQHARCRARPSGAGHLRLATDRHQRSRNCVPAGSRAHARHHQHPRLGGHCRHAQRAGRGGRRPCGAQPWLAGGCVHRPLVGGGSVCRARRRDRELATRDSPQRRALPLFALGRVGVARGAHSPTGHGHHAHHQPGATRHGGHHPRQAGRHLGRARHDDWHRQPHPHGQRHWRVGLGRRGLGSPDRHVWHAHHAAHSRCGGCQAGGAVATSGIGHRLGLDRHPAFAPPGCDRRVCGVLRLRRVHLERGRPRRGGQHGA